MDPRRYQIAALTALVAYGLVWLRFDLRPSIAATLVATALATQWWGWRLTSASPTDYKSALISGLSLCLLLRTGSVAVAAFAAFLTIGSKFAIRVRGKHIFNPTNFGIVATLIAVSDAWVSPGQWGDAALFAFAVACVGLLVVTRAARADVTLAFIAAYGTLLVTRSLWLGEPTAIPLHRLQSGAFLIFAFFMISDPKTTPDSRAGRILFATVVALGAYYVQFKLFRPNGLLWSLAVCSPLVPLIDWIDGGRYVDAKRGPESLHDDRQPRLAGALRLSPPGGILRLLRGARGRDALQPGVAGRARP
jgi:enediyne biosynthesis protein E5